MVLPGGAIFYSDFTQAPLKHHFQAFPETVSHPDA
jgi:hypothetical protein